MDEMNTQSRKFYIPNLFKRQSICGPWRTMHPFLVSCLFLVIADYSHARQPIILVPGYTGSQLTATLNRTRVSRLWCSNKSSMFNIWFNAMNMLPFRIDCWQDNFRLHYDRQNRRTNNTEGVDIATVNFGSTESMENISPLATPLTNYLSNLVTFLETRGYRKDVDLRGAPYDWRRGPNDNEHFHVSLKKLMESTCKTNDGKRSVIMCHSMGCNYVHAFLLKQSSEWKEKHVSGLVSVAAPWGGTVRALYSYLAIDDAIVTQILPLIRSVERTFSSTAFLLPSQRVFGDRILIETPYGNVSTSNYQSFFKSIGNEDAYDMWSDGRYLNEQLLHPGVTVHCVIGIGYATRERIIYDHNVLDGQISNVIYGDGDDYVNVGSARGCRQWNNSSHQFSYHELNHNHNGLIMNQDSLKYLMQLIQDLK